MATQDTNNRDETSGTDTDKPLSLSQNISLEDIAKPDLKKELLKLFVLACAALGIFTVFNTWPSIYTAAGGVLVMVGVARASEWASMQTEHLSFRNRSVLVTGCDTGFGNALAKELAKRGVTVFACCLSETSEGATTLKEKEWAKLHVIEMDVTKPPHITECLEKVTNLLNGSGLWGLVNNAGLNMLGDIELTTMEQFERTADINSLGMVRVTKAFLPLIRKARGRVVNVTSVKGIVSEPLCAAYAMSKYAAETFSDILRMEMKKFAVKVSIIEPGNFGGATASLEMGRIRADLAAMWAEAPKEIRQCYGEEYLEEHAKSTEQAIPTANMDVSPVIKAMMDALFSLSPKARYHVPGGSGWYDHHFLRARLAAILPESISDGLWLHDLRKWPAPLAVLNDPTLAHGH